MNINTYEYGACSWRFSKYLGIAGLVYISLVLTILSAFGQSQSQRVVSSYSYSYSTTHKVVEKTLSAFGEPEREGRAPAVQPRASYYNSFGRSIISKQGGGSASVTEFRNPCTGKTYISTTVTSYRSEYNTPKWEYRDPYFLGKGAYGGRYGYGTTSSFQGAPSGQLLRTLGVRK